MLTQPERALLEHAIAAAKIPFQQVMGRQIEGFMTELMYRHPNLADILSVARLRGITREEAVAAEQAHRQAPQVAVVTHVLERRIA